MIIFFSEITKSKGKYEKEGLSYFYCGSELIQQVNYLYPWHGKWRKVIRPLGRSSLPIRPTIAKPL